MINIKPFNQTKLFGLDKFIMELINLEEKKKLPNKILLSGQKGLGKSTLAYHLINYVLTKDEKHSYNINKFQINPDNNSFKTVLNKSNPNLTIIDVTFERKIIDISQIRDVISALNKSSFNEKPRFVLIDNIEFLNTNSINALLKILEEPTLNVHFILINNNKKILPTLLSRCLNFKIYLSNNEKLLVTENLLDGKIDSFINKDLINYYSTPGNIYKIVKFSEDNNYNLLNLNLKEFIKIIIKNVHYKKDVSIKYLFFDYIEFYLNKINSNISLEFFDRYNYFLKKISDVQKFNLDEESLFIEIEKEMLNE
tara:strand:+ start:108 stop:1040 length:933 start_codon:yes stop_codon:yes gene_type:complete